MRIPAKLLLPIGILGAGVVGSVLIAVMRPTVEPGRPEVTAPLVRVEIATPSTVNFIVRAHGTVAPRTESDLIPQVTGPVVWVSPALASGGFFELDEPLIRIDPADYSVGLESARAAVARNTSEYERAKKELERQQRLASKSIASASRFDDAANGERIAAAALRESVAQRERAERDLARTEIRAPYSGRVRDENVDVGQFVTRGTSIGRIYAVDYAEVRLPVPDAELRFVDLPMLYRGESSDVAGPTVQLRADFAGGKYTWEGRIVRTEGEIDARSRMVHVVARVEDPYGRVGGNARDPEDSADHAAEVTPAGEVPEDVSNEETLEAVAIVEDEAPMETADPKVAEAVEAVEIADLEPLVKVADESSGDLERPPLAVGLFVEADIRGKRVEGAFVLPRSALRNGDEVLIVDGENRLRRRAVDVLRNEDERVVIGGGLRAGEAVVVSPLLAAVEGMVVRIEGAESEGAEGAGSEGEHDGSVDASAASADET